MNAMSRIKYRSPSQAQGCHDSNKVKHIIGNFHPNNLQHHFLYHPLQPPNAYERKEIQEGKINKEEL
jgi:hypothetical protein